MVNKKIIFFAILFVGLLAVSTVSAAENSTNDIINSEQNTVDLAISDDSDVIAVESDDDTLSATQSDTLSPSQGKYQELSDLIDKTKENGVIKLKKDYKYDDSFSNVGITIDKAITIDGNGHYIDGNNLARAFYITGKNVTIKNILFKNCFRGNGYGVCGGSIYWKGDYGLLVNCNFLNSKSVTSNNNYQSYNHYSYGGAVYWSGYGGKLTNCNFRDCYSSYNDQTTYQNSIRGGAVYWSGDRGVITNSRFTYCTANAYTTSDGGAVYFYGASCELKNCDFTNCFSNSKNTANGAAVSWSGNSGLIEYCRFVGNSEKENGVVYISGKYMDVESSYFCDNNVIDLYWTGSGEVHNSVLYKKTSSYPIYSTNNNINANYNWWGNTNLDYNKRISLPSRITVNNWLYLTANTNKNSLFVGETANININLNNLYSSSTGEISQYSNSKLPLVPFTVIDESFTNYISINKGFGVYKYVAKSVPMDPVIVQFDTHVNIFKFNVKKVSSKIISPQVNTVYNSGKYLIATLKDAYNHPVSGATVGITIAGKTHLLTTDYFGQVKVSLKGIKPKKYTAKIQFVGDKNYYPSSLSTKVIIKKATPKLKVTKTFKKKSKKKIVKVTVKDGVGPIKKVKVTLKVKGKTFKGKTNNKGLVKFDVSKKLKKTGKYKAKINIKKSKLYNKVNKKIKIVVKK